MAHSPLVSHRWWNISRCWHPFQSSSCPLEPLQGYTQVWILGRKNTYRKFQDHSHKILLVWSYQKCRSRTLTFVRAVTPRQKQQRSKETMDTIFFSFNWRLITLQYRGGFCHTFTRIAQGCTCVPHPEPPSQLNPHPIAQCHPSAPALSTLSHASNLDRWSISHMVIYMFQCYSLRSSHPRLLPQNSKVCSLHLCLLCCLAYRVLNVRIRRPVFALGIIIQ